MEEGIGKSPARPDKHESAIESSPLASRVAGNGSSGMSQQFKLSVTVLH